MTKHYTIGLDVGRTFVRSALLDEKGNILPDSFSIFSSKSSESKEIILRNFVKIIKFNINSILHPDFDIQYIGFAISNDFNLKDIQVGLIENELRKYLIEVPSIKAKLSKSYQLYIEREVKLFAMGEYVLRTQVNKKRRILYLILDSSISISLMENGIFKDGAAVINSSSLVITEIANSLGIIKSELNTKKIAELAMVKDSRALEVYEVYGRNLGLALKPIIDSFSPHEMIVGGNIALSYPLFENTFVQTINQESIQIHPTKFTSYYVFFGLSEIVKMENSIIEL